MLGIQQSSSVSKEALGRPDLLLFKTVHTLAYRDHQRPNCPGFSEDRLSFSPHALPGDSSICPSGSDLMGHDAAGGHVVPRRAG